MSDEDLKIWCHLLNQLVERGADIRVQIAVQTGESITPRKFRCKPFFHVEHGKISGNAYEYGPFAGFDPWYEFGLRIMQKPHIENAPI